MVTCTQFSHTLILFPLYGYVIVVIELDTDTVLPLSKIIYFFDSQAASHLISVPVLPPGVVVRINKYTNKKLSKKSGKLINAQ